MQLFQSLRLPEFLLFHHTYWIYFVRLNKDLDLKPVTKAEQSVSSSGLPVAAPTRIVIFAKAPVPGKVKTRLIPALGDVAAAQLARRMLADTVQHALSAKLSIPEVCVTPDFDDLEWKGQLPSGIELSNQGPGNLGDRMAVAARRVIDRGECILLVGIDCPDLDNKRLIEAAAQLQKHDAVIHPARDGGYVLLGLKRTDPSLFDDIAWSTDTVAATTIARVQALGWSFWVGDTMSDIDEPADLVALATNRSQMSIL